MKRLGHALLALCLVLVTVTAGAQMYIRPGQLSQSWRCTKTNLSGGLVTCQAGTAGYRLYVTDIVVQTATSTTAGDYSIQYGSSPTCSTNQTALFPSDGSPSATSTLKASVPSNPATHISLVTPLIAGVGQDICVFGGSLGDPINIFLSGFLGL